MSTLSLARAQNAQRYIQHLSETGPEGATRRAWTRYCAEPIEDRAATLKAALDALAPDTRRRICSAMGG